MICPSVNLFPFMEGPPYLHILVAGLSFPPGSIFRAQVRSIVNLPLKG